LFHISTLRRGQGICAPRFGYAKAAGHLAWSGRALRSACSCLNLMLACIVYWQAWEISWVPSKCDPVANGIDLILLERVSPIEWDNVEHLKNEVMWKLAAAAFIAISSSVSHFR
jgi:hypothetical protein